MAFEHGAPWSQQSGINSSQSGDLSTAWISGTNLPVGFAAGQALLIKNKVHLFAFASEPTIDYSYILTYDVDASGVVSSSYSTSSGTVVSRHARAVVIGPYVYLFGAFTGGAFTSSVYRAEIDLNDGALGGFSYYGELPLAYGGFSAAVIKNRLYLFGGTWSSTSTNVRASVYYAAIDSAGDLGSWNSSGDLSYGVKYSQLVITSGYIYLLGGATYNSQTYACQRAQRNVDGSLGAWATVSGLTVPDSAPLYGAAVVASDDAFYLFGGRTGALLTNISNNVRYGAIDSNGEITSFSVSGTSLYAYSYAGAYECAALVTSSRVYVFGGIDAYGTYTSHTQYHAYSGGLNDYTAYIGEVQQDTVYGYSEQLSPTAIGEATTPIICSGISYQGEPESTGLGQSGAISGYSEQASPAATGLAETPIICIGHSEQACPDVIGTGWLYIYSDGYSEQACPEGSGSAYDLNQSPLYADGYSEQSCPDGSGSAENTNTAALSEQGAPVATGFATVPTVAFGLSQVWLPRSNGLAYVGEFVSAGYSEQSAPMSSGSATTWNLAIGVSDQGAPISSGDAINAAPIMALGYSEQACPIISGTATTQYGIFCFGHTEQACSEASGTGYAINLASGYSEQIRPESFGVIHISPYTESLHFSRCGTSTYGLLDPDTIIYTAFSRCTSGIPVSEDYTQDMPILSFTRERT